MLLGRESPASERPDRCDGETVERLHGRRALGGAASRTPDVFNGGGGGPAAQACMNFLCSFTFDGRYYL